MVRIISLRNHCQILDAFLAIIKIKLWDSTGFRFLTDCKTKGANWNGIPGVLFTARIRVIGVNLDQDKRNLVRVSEKFELSKGE